MAAIVKARASRPAPSGFSTSRTLAHRAIDGEPVPGHLRGRGRAVRHRPSARRARHRRVRAGPGRRARRGPGRPGAGDGLDAAPGRRDRPARHVRPDPEQRRPRRRGSGCSTCRRRRPPRACRCAPRCTAAPSRCCSASRRSTRSPSPRRGATPGSACSRGRSRWPASRPTPTCAARIVADAAPLEDDPIVTGFMHPSRIFVLGDPPVYEPGPERSATAIAAARGVDEWELLLELFLGDGGRELLNAPVLNYTDGNLDAVRRDAPAPHVRLRPRRRRRPRRADLRRVDHHLPAHALGARPRPRPADRRGGRAQDDPGHRHALRPRRPRRARAGLRRRRQRDRPRAACSCAGPSW